MNITACSAFQLKFRNTPAKRKKGLALYYYLHTSGRVLENFFTQSNFGFAKRKVRNSCFIASPSHSDN